MKATVWIGIYYCLLTPGDRFCHAVFTDENEANEFAALIRRANNRPAAGPIKVEAELT